jgi:hypothetical protein
MGMGTWGNRATIIEEKDVKSLCPKEFEELLQVFETHGVSEDAFCWSEFARAAEWSEWDVDKQDFELAWDVLQEAFVEATTVGNSHLNLHMGYYDPECGDRYDELDGGHFFYVTGDTQLSPAGERFKNMLQEKSWTVFG